MNSVDMARLRYMMAARESTKRAYVSFIHARAHARLGEIARFIAAGGDPTKDPGYRDDYLVLVSEDGGKALEDEVRGLFMTKEETTI